MHLSECASLLTKIGDQQRLIRELTEALEKFPNKNDGLIERAYRMLGDKAGAA